MSPGLESVPSKMEVATLRAIIQHGTISRAADALCLSTHTVDTHLDNLRQKTGRRYLCQIVAIAAEYGWLAGDE